MVLTSIKAALNEPLYTSNEHASLVFSILYRHDDGVGLSQEEINAIKENKVEHVPVAGLGNPVKNDRGDMWFYGSTAVVPVLGTMFKRGDWLTNMCGMVSTQRMIKLVGEAADNPDVSQIVLEIDSPGGMVSGTHELWQAVMTAKKKKPVYALVGDAFSAAFYVASACTAIYLTSPSSGIGNAGVATQHINMKAFYEQRGFEVTDVASEGKRDVSSVKPLDEKAQKILQDLVNSYYAVFLDAVAEGRNQTAEYVHENWGKGKIFIGQQAIDLGIVDGYSSLEELIKGDPMATKTEPAATQNNEIVTVETTAVTVTQSNETVELQKQIQQIEQKQKDLMSMFGNLQTATEMKNQGKLTPHAFATIFGANTGDPEQTMTAINAFCSANGNDPVKAALALVSSMGFKPDTMKETVSETFVIERPAGSPEREKKEESALPQTVVAGLKIDV